MNKHKINLVTMTDVNEFVKIAGNCDGWVHVTDRDRNYICNGKSLLGLLYSMEWSEVYCEAENDIYSKIERFIAE